MGGRQLGRGRQSSTSSDISAEQFAQGVDRVGDTTRDGAPPTQFRAPEGSTVIYFVCYTVNNIVYTPRYELKSFSVDSMPTLILKLVAELVSFSIARMFIGLLEQ